MPIVEILPRKWVSLSIKRVVREVLRASKECNLKPRETMFRCEALLYHKSILRRLQNAEYSKIVTIHET